MKNGVVYLNVDKLSVDAFVHELGHLWIEMYSRLNPTQYLELTERILQEVKGSRFYDELRRQYADYDEHSFEVEVLAHLLQYRAMEAYTTLKNQHNGILPELIELLHQAVLKVIQYITGKNVPLSAVSGNTLKHMAMYMANSMVGNPSMVNLEIYSDMAKYEYRENKIRNVNELILELLSGENDFERLNLNEKVEYIFRRVRKTVNGRMVIVNGKVLTFENDENDAQVKAKIQEVVNKDVHEFDNEIKSTIVSFFANGMSVHPEAIRELADRFKQKNINLSYSTIKELVKHMGIDDSKAILRLSDLGVWLKGHGIAMQETIPDSLIGLNPIVVVESIVTVDGKKKAMVSLYDITPESLHYMDTNGKNKSLFKNVISKVGIKIGMQSKKLDARKLVMAITANRLMRNGLLVNNLSVTGLYSSEYDGGRIAPNAIDMVSINRDIETVGKEKEFMDRIDDYELQKEFKKENLVNKQRLLVDMLLSYWQEKLNEEQLLGYDLTDSSNLTRNIIRLITIRMKDYENKSDRSITANEYTLMAKVLVELNTMDVPASQLNEMHSLSAISEKIKPSFAIKNDMVQAVVKRVSETIYRLGNKMEGWRKVFAGIYSAYDKYFEGAKGARPIIAQGSSLFEKGFAKVKAKTENGTYEERLINYLLWTVDPNEDPIFYEQAKKLPKEILEANRKVVDMIEELMVEVVYHDRVNRLGLMKGPKGKREKYTMDDARKTLTQKYGYRKGFMPILSKTPGEMLHSSNVKDAIQRYIDKHRNAALLFEEASRDELLSITDNDLSVQLLDMLKGSPMAEYGSESMLKRLGMQYDMKTGELVVFDSNAGKAMSTNLEIITYYTVLAANRKQMYESDVIPLANAVLFLLKNGKDANVHTQEEIKFLEEYIRSVIFNQGQTLTGKVLGQSVEPVLAAAMSAVGTTALAYNINVAVGSALYNASALFSEALAHTFNSLAGNEKPPFTVKTAARAFVEVITNMKKSMAIATALKLVNSSESDLISHQYNLKTKTSLISQFGANIGNWITDVHSRLTTMAAIMMEEGSWDAYYLDADGKLKYDQKKDKRWKTAEGKLILEKVKNELVRVGVMGSVNDEMPIGHDFNTIKSIKTISDRYIIAAYDKDVRTQINNQILGRMFSMFKQFIYTRIDNAFASGGYLESIGSWKVVKDENGKELVEWERQYMEGYLVSVMNAIIEIKRARGLSGLKNLNEAQKNNLARAAARVIIFMLLYALYNGIVDDDDDDDDIGFMKDRRIVKNIKYAYTEFLIVSPSFWTEITAKPFALTSIIERIFDERLGGTPFGRFANAFVPGYNTAKTLSEAFKSDDRIRYEDYLRRKEAAKKANETKKEREKEGYYDYQNKFK